MKLRDIWTDFREVFAKSSNLDKARLTLLVNINTGELLVKPSRFCLELFNAYCGSAAFRMVFDYDISTENAIRSNYSGNENKFVKKLLGDIVGGKFNGEGPVMVFDGDYYQGYVTVGSDYHFIFHVFEVYDGDDDVEIGLNLLEAFVLQMDIAVLRSVTDFFCYKKNLIYKLMGHADFFVDRKGFSDLDGAQQFIEDVLEFPHEPLEVGDFDDYQSEGSGTTWVITREDDAYELGDELKRFRVANEKGDWFFCFFGEDLNHTEDEEGEYYPMDKVPDAEELIAHIKENLL
jgi:hypothetical protein